MRVKQWLAYFICTLSCMASVEAHAGAGIVVVPAFHQYFSAQYTPSDENLALLKELKPHLAPIKIAGFTSESYAKHYILCRMSYPVYTPDKMTFADLIAEAMKADLTAAGLYSEEQGVPLKGDLTDIDLDTLMHGKWKFEASLSVAGKSPLTFRHEFEYKTKGEAGAACGLARNAMIPAVQAYLYALYSDPGFQALIGPAQAGKNTEDAPTSTSLPEGKGAAMGAANTPTGGTNGGVSIAGLYSAGHRISTSEGKVKVDDFVNIDRDGKVEVYVQGADAAGKECYLPASGDEPNSPLQGRTLTQGESPNGERDYETKIGDDTFGILAQPDNSGNLQWFFHLAKPNRTIKFTGAANTILIAGQFYGLGGKALTSPTLDQLRATQCAEGIALGGFDHSRYVIKGSEIYDKKTNLTWQRCSVGQQWIEGTGCTGNVQQYTFGDAQKVANGNWRVPTKEELSTLIDYERVDRQQNPAIDVVAFPDMDMHKQAYWSSTPAEGKDAWAVSFFTGSVFHQDAHDGLHSVRLVREGQ